MPRPFRAAAFSVLLAIGAAGAESPFPPPDLPEDQVFCWAYQRKPPTREHWWRRAIKANHSYPDEVIFPAFREALDAFRADDPERGLERLRHVAYREVILEDDEWEAKERAGELHWIIRVCDPEWQAKMPDVPLVPTKEDWRTRYLP